MALSALILAICSEGKRVLHPAMKVVSGTAYLALGGGSPYALEVPEGAGCATLRGGMTDDAPQNNDGGAFDVVMFHGKTADGEGARVLRARPGRVDAGEVRPMREGKPLTAGEVVRLEPRKDAPALFDVKVEHVVQGLPSSPTHGGPAQVATAEYREAWERTFGPGSSALN
jgi:hypothetical protein